MPLQATSGAASYDAFGGGVPVAVNYIENVFSTWLYSGGSSDIPNGIDLAGKGGLVWIKRRSATSNHELFDTVRGINNGLQSNLTDAQSDFADSMQADSTGFTLRFDSPYYPELNASGSTYASWTFRKQPKFFDIQTWTGTGSNTTISHSLGSVPACIFVKRTDAVGAWQVYHRSLANTEYLVLNTTAAKATGATRWNSTTPTSTVFSLGTDATVNASGGTYVAYIFAHDAGGFGLTGTDNVISCGSYTGTGGALSVNVGFEPQWLLVKKAVGDNSNEWELNDNMRGLALNNSNRLEANSALAEGGSPAAANATGFSILSGSSRYNTTGHTYIYIAIRRGPMKVPTSGTSVFSPVLQNGGGTVTTGFPADFVLATTTSFNTEFNIQDRLRGAFQNLSTPTTAAEANYSPQGYNLNLSNTSFLDNYNDASYSTIYENLRRAPNFFDEVCYTGTGSATTFSHNLGAVPELMIVKKRSAADSWFVYVSSLGNNKTLTLNTTGSSGTSATAWNSTTPTSSVFSVGATATNTSGATYVAYLFATCAGVSKVGSYTGTATTKQIDCGFTAGARFVLIKRTDSTGDWYVWDTARGIVSGNDSYLLLNSTAAEVTNTDYIDTYSAGFELSSTAPAAINASGGTFIFLAIA